MRFEGASTNPIAAKLPAFICLPLDQIKGLSDVLALLFCEAFQQGCGPKALFERLFEVVLIQIPRHLVDSGETQIGVLAGPAHPRLQLAIIAMHE